MSPVVAAIGEAALSAILKQVSNMANTGSGSLATILSLFMIQAALYKGRTFSLLLSKRNAHFPPQISTDAHGGVSFFFLLLLIGGATRERARQSGLDVRCC